MFLSRFREKKRGELFWVCFSRVDRKRALALVILERMRELRKRVVSVKEKRKGNSSFFLSPIVSNSGALLFFFSVLAIVLHV